MPLINHAEGYFLGFELSPDDLVVLGEPFYDFHIPAAFPFAALPLGCAPNATSYYIALGVR
jgi:hypothetical protein